MTVARTKRINGTKALCILRYAPQLPPDQFDSFDLNNDDHLQPLWQTSPEDHRSLSTTPAARAALAMAHAGPLSTPRLLYPCTSMCLRERV